MTPTIILFDIDGTLIDGRGAGRRAMEGAIMAIAGDDGGLPRMRFAGMTDRQIVRAGLSTLGRADADDELCAVLDEYLARLPSELRATPPHVHEGVHAMLDALADRSHVAIGLGTGNLQSGARLKLSAVALWERFAFGGFGCDAEDRAALLRAGIDRGAGRLGRAPTECRVVVIGDTPLDIAAAQAVGARSLAVATSFYTVAELTRAGASHAVESLAAPGAIAAIFAE